MKIKNLIKNRKNWTTGAYARDKWGHDIYSSSDPRAVRFCLLGAIYKCYPTKNIAAVFTKLKTLIKRDFHASASDISGFNDNHTHAEVLKIVNKANV